MVSVQTHKKVPPEEMVLPLQLTLCCDHLKAVNVETLLQHLLTTPLPHGGIGQSEGSTLTSILQPAAWVTWKKVHHGLSRAARLVDGLDLRQCKTF